ncbi:NACHT domain-containing protein [Nonomuraea typhae]|uniref:NACHT domain-containing protein n=1 Tax=Nonomuraea typhae TaxID=2603600 RepID=A0ABW7YWQ2_9ACTN
MQRVAKIIFVAFLLLSIAFAAVFAAVASNQILNNETLDLAWLPWAFGISLLGLLLTFAVELTRQTREPLAPDKSSVLRPARHRYRQRVRRSAEKMETLGLITDIEYTLLTRQVYVDVILQPRPVVSTTADPGVGCTHARSVHDGSIASSDSTAEAVEDRAVGPRTQLRPLLAKRRVLVVLGAAGSGKTTLARYTALELTEREWRPWQRRFWRRQPVPILLYLRDHARMILGPNQGDEPSGLADVAAANPFLRGVVSVAWLTKQLDKGRCVVLLDGLDEVADHYERKRVVRWVEDQIARYPDNAFVITSRPHGYNENRLASVDVLHVQQFTAEQIKRFLHAWYRAVERRAGGDDPAEIDRTAATSADMLFDRISAQPALYDLAANPLLLTMTATVHRYCGQLPDSRAALYAEMCLVLLHRRQEDKGVLHPIDRVLSGSQKERIIQELAWHMMCSRERYASSTEVCAVVREMLHRAAPDLASKDFLEHVRRSGLLVEYRHDHYGFIHPTLQEYLAAASVRSDERRQHLGRSVSEPWWRETILLSTAGADATEVVQACLNTRTVHALSLAFACVEVSRTLDCDLRDHLSGLLTTAPADPEEARLLNGVAASRALHETLLLPTGTRICAHRVPADLWDRYTTTRDIAPIDSQRTLGLQTEDITGFLLWLSEILPDTSYRLPTSDEACNAFATFRIPHPALWTAQDARERPVLTSRPGHPHPYLPTPQQISRHASRITDRIDLLLLLNTFSSAAIPRKLFGQPAHGDPDPLERPLFDALDLVFLLHHALGVDQVSDDVRDSARDFALDLVRDLDRDYGLVSADIRDLVRNLAYDLVRNRGLARDLERARDLALNLAYALDRAIAPGYGLDSALNLADPDPVLTFRLARGNSSLGLAPDLVAFGRSLARAVDLPADLQHMLDQSDWADMDLQTKLGLMLACRDLLHAYLNLRAAAGQREQPSNEGFSRFLLGMTKGLAGVDRPVDDPSAALAQTANVLIQQRTNQFIAGVQIAAASRLINHARQQPGGVNRDLPDASVCVLAAIGRINQDVPSRHLAITLGGVLASLIALTSDEDQHSRGVVASPAITLVRA